MVIITIIIFIFYRNIHNTYISDSFTILYSFCIITEFQHKRITIFDYFTKCLVITLILKSMVIIICSASYACVEVVLFRDFLRVSLSGHRLSTFLYNIIGISIKILPRNSI